MAFFPPKPGKPIEKETPTYKTPVIKSKPQLNSEEIQKLKRRLKAARNQQRDLLGDIPWLDGKVSEYEGTVNHYERMLSADWPPADEKKFRKKLDTATKNLSAAREKVRTAKGDLDDVNERISNIEQRILDLQTERVADNSSAMVFSKPEKSNDKENELNSYSVKKIEKTSVKENSFLPGNSDPELSEIQSNGLPPLIRRDGQKLKKPELLYPALSYQENVHEIWPAEAIEQATKLYPDMPERIEASRQLVPDNPEDLLDPDYFEMPENPRLKDLALHSIWQNKKQGTF
jgi:hypothetical protein